MNKQHGFINIDYTSFIVTLVVIGTLVGVLLCKFVPWVWSLIKPIIHALTA